MFSINAFNLRLSTHPYGIYLGRVGLQGSMDFQAYRGFFLLGSVSKHDVDGSENVI